MEKKMTEVYFRNDLDLEFPVKEVFKLDGKKVAKKTCGKCDGNKYLLHFGNTDEGRCWGCHAKGYITARVYTAKELRPVIKASEKRRMARIAKAQLESEIWSIQQMGYKHKSYLSNVAFKTKKIKAKYQSEYVGQVGDRLEKSLTLDWCIKKDGDYGVYYIKKLHDEDGNIYSHMGSAIYDEDDKLIAKGTTFTLKFTVKDHSEYQGTKQTKIKNPKFVKGE